MRRWWPNKRKDWDPIKSEELDILACETLVMQFLKLTDDPITKNNLYDFWKYLQDRKDYLSRKGKKREKD